MGAPVSDAHDLTPATSIVEMNMIKVLEDAIEKVRKLPEHKQKFAAETLDHIASRPETVFKIPDDDLAAIIEAEEQVKRGEFASDEEMAALWKKCGL